jgi:type VI protein secretion system component Hcp
MSRAVDVVSAQLQQALLTGELLTSVEFFFRKSGGEGPGKQPFLTFTLTNACITSIQMHSDSGNEGLVAEIQLAFGQSNLEIHNIDPRTGQVTTSTTVGYDLTKAALI